MCVGEKTVSVFDVEGPHVPLRHRLTGDVGHPEEVLEQGQVHVPVVAIVG